MKIILNIIFSPLKDIIYDRLIRERVVNKQFFMLAMTFLLLFVTFIVCLIFWFSMSQPYDPRIFIVYPDNKKQEIISLSSPIQSIENVRRWTGDALGHIYSFDFNNIDRQIEGAEVYFTSYAYKEYLDSLEQNKIKDNVLSKNIIISIVPLSAPIPVNGGLYGGKIYFWKLRVPILLVYQSSGSVVSSEKAIEVDVIKVPTHQNPSGLAISRFQIYAHQR